MFMSFQNTPGVGTAPTDAGRGARGQTGMSKKWGITADTSTYDYFN